MVRQKRGMARPAILVCLLVVALIGAVGYWWFNREPTKKNPPLTTENAKRLVRLAEEANVCLENEYFRDGFELAEERFKELEKELPESLFVCRNRVISRILFFLKNKDEYKDNQEFIDETTRLAEELIEKEGSAFEPYLLAVRWRYYVTSDITETDVELLERAIQNAGSSPCPLFRVLRQDIDS